MSYPPAFFALMTHKSVTCAIFPNKPGVPLTEKNQVHMYIFLETGSANFIFCHTRVFYAFRLRYVFPPLREPWSKGSLGVRPINYEPD